MKEYITPKAEQRRFCVSDIVTLSLYTYDGEEVGKDQINNEVKWETTTSN